MSSPRITQHALQLTHSLLHSSTLNQTINVILKLTALNLNGMFSVQFWNKLEVQSGFSSRHVAPECITVVKWPSVKEWGCSEVSATFTCSNVEELGFSGEDESMRASNMSPCSSVVWSKFTHGSKSDTHQPLRFSAESSVVHSGSPLKMLLVEVQTLCGVFKFSVKAENGFLYSKWKERQEKKLLKSSNT